jgi:hypothetical protein
MARLFDRIHGEINIIALDSCFSGGFAKDVIVKPKRMGFFSSEEDLTSQVAGKFQAGGYLSYFFRKGLVGDANIFPRDRELTAGELSHYLIIKFAEEVGYVSSTNNEGSSNGGFQHLVVDRGGVRSNTVIRNVASN